MIRGTPLAVIDTVMLVCDVCGAESKAKEISGAHK